MDIRARFQRLATEWKERSCHLSNVVQMAMLPSYQRIIGMGWDAVPLILEELRREPDQWFWALEAITEENPVPCEAAGKIRLMAEAWINWAEQRGLLGNDFHPSEAYPALDQTFAEGWDDPVMDAYDQDEERKP